MLPAKRSVTEVRQLSYKELLTVLGIETDGLTDVILQLSPSSTRGIKGLLTGSVTIVTKTESEVCS